MRSFTGYLTPLGDGDALICNEMLRGKQGDIGVCSLPIHTARGFAGQPLSSRKQLLFPFEATDHSGNTFTTAFYCNLFDFVFIIILVIFFLPAVPTVKFFDLFVLLPAVYVVTLQ